MSSTQPNPFAPAVRAAMTAKVMIVGLAGAGKTYTSLLAMRELVGDGGRVAVIDTERRTSTLYADEIGFDVSHVGPFGDRWNPTQYIDKLIADARAAEAHGYDGLILDSGSHEWDAILRVVDLNNKGGLSGWLVGTPLHERFVNAMLGLDLHLIVTARSNSDWVVNEVTRTGKDGRERTVNEPTKVGMKARQREGLDYEFQLVGNVELGTHTMRVEKTRVRQFADAVVDPSRTLEFWTEYRDWLATGKDLSSPAQLQQLEALIAETKSLGDQGRTVRDELRYLRDCAGATTIDELSKAEAQALIVWTRDRIEDVHGRAATAGQEDSDTGDAPDPAPGGSEPSTGDDSARSGDTGPALPDGCTGAWFDLDDGTGQAIGHPDDAAPCPVHPRLTDAAPAAGDDAAPFAPTPTGSPTTSEASASPPEPSSSPAAEGDAPIASSPEAPDPTSEATIPGSTFWLPAHAVQRFAVVLGWAYGTTVDELTDDVLVHAAQTAYDPTWATDGATESDLLDAASAITSRAVDSLEELHPDQPHARELIGLVRERWPNPGEPQDDPPSPEPDDETGATVSVDPRPSARRGRARASR